VLSGSSWEGAVKKPLRSNAESNGWKLIGLTIALILGGCAHTEKAPAISQGLSGYEIFPGKISGSATTGALFSGWTNESKSPWQGASSSGGTWSVTANYSGRPGIDNAVNVTGGKWVLTLGDAVILGKVAGGKITWPSSLNSDVSGRGCGQGIGYVAVSLTTNEGRSGSMTGCLDDTHVFLGTFPPKLWGTLMIP
jgi:hypothetical protein